MHSATTLDLPALIRSHSAGHALTREFYTDPEIFERDMQRILLRHWFCAAHESSVPRAGDFLVVDLGAESVIIVRTSQGEIRALLNVCRHRGSRICTARSGKAPAGRLTCPYHAWSYDLNGRLVVAQQMPEPFERNRLSLKSLAVRVVDGLIFTTFAERPLDFAPAEAALARSAHVHGWGKAKVAHRELYSIKANWKLAIENYMECYHCKPAHPEFSRRHVYARPAKQVEELEKSGRRRAEALGIFIADLDGYGCAAKPGGESVSVFRSALYDGVASATSDGQPVARLMGDFADYDGNSTYFDIGPLSDFLAYADHGVIYRFIPRAVQHTEMEVVWLVHEDAVEGKDYDLERLTWLWNTTSAEDKKIVEANQAGVNSRFFVPGPYSLQEPYALRFIEWYLSELAVPA
jgi:phenylpropionate dioxygenase-like ring-hydroxylating dioxygenase large terminal subunit